MPHSRSCGTQNARFCWRPCWAASSSGSASFSKIAEQQAGSRSLSAVLYRFAGIKRSNHETYKHHIPRHAGRKLSAVLVAAGSSAGLGNIWRFPYIAGDNGGGAFLVIYILCVLLLGLPLMLAEFTVGRASHRNAVGALPRPRPEMGSSGIHRRAVGLPHSGLLPRGLGLTAEYMVHSLTGDLARYPRPRSMSRSSRTSSATPGGRCSTR